MSDPNQSQRLATLTLDELVAEAGDRTPGSVAHGRYMVELARRQTVIQKEAAQAQSASARYIFWTAAATAVAAAAAAATVILSALHR